jgi:3-oxoacyl-[acyl-carrier-protein] synthase II
MNMNDIAITGIGIVSPLGVGRETFWENVRKAKSGIKRVTHFETSSFRSNIAGWVDDFDPGQYMPSRSYRRLSRISRMAVAASVEALTDSGLVLESLDKERIAIIVGTSYGSSSHVEDFFVSLLKEGPRGAQPLLFPETVPNAPASHIAIFHGITGPNSTFCQNDISAENAIIYARKLLLQNYADIVLVGGAEELSAMLYSCYDAVLALNRIKVDNDGSVTPKIGGGIVLGEGAGIIVMERLDFARERGAEIYGLLQPGVITGGATSIGHYEISGEQMARALCLAMREAGLGPDDIDAIDISANGSGELERIECDQLVNVFNNRSGNLELTPLKYLMGDFGGAGIIRAAAVLLSISRQSPLPTINADVLKNETHTYPEWNIKQTGTIDNILMTSSTFGGSSCSLIFTKY